MVLNKMNLLIPLALVLIGCTEICPAPEPCPTCQQCEVCEVCKEPTDSALLSDYFVSWGKNVDETKTLFDYQLYNFGKIEAKDIEVTCYVDDFNDNRVFENTESIGSVGSRSWIQKQMLTSRTFPVSYIASCYVSSCDGCIILADQIEEFKKYR